MPPPKKKVKSASNALAQKNVMSNTIKSLKTEQTIVKYELNIQKKENLGLEEQLQTNNYKLKELDDRIYAINETNNDLQEKLLIAENENSQLKRTLCLLKSANDTLKKECDLMKSKLNDNESFIRKLQYKKKTRKLGAVENLKTRQLQHRISTVLQIIQKYNPSMNRKFYEKIANKLSPRQTSVTKKQNLNGEQALAFSKFVGVTLDQLEKCKKFLKFFNIDFLPPVKLIRLTKQMAASFCSYEDGMVQIGDEKVHYRRATNIKEAIEYRLRLLFQHGLLNIAQLREIIIGLNADKGGKIVKFTISIGNVIYAPESPFNLLFIGAAFAKDDNIEIINKVFTTTLDQYNNLETLTFTLNDTVYTFKCKKIVSGDGKILSVCTGHCGAQSTCACMLCPLKNLMHPPLPLRNIEKMTEDGIYFQEHAKGKKGKALTDLRTKCESIVAPPVVKIPLKNYVYGAGHAIGGPAQAVLKEAEERALILDCGEKDLKKQTKMLSLKKKQMLESLQVQQKEYKNDVLLGKLIESAYKRMLKGKKNTTEERVCSYPICLEHDKQHDKLNLHEMVTCSTVNCPNMTHLSCALIISTLERREVKDNIFFCHECQEIDESELLQDFHMKLSRWQELIVEKDKEIKQLKEEISKESDTDSFDDCPNYQRIQSFLKDHDIKKNLQFASLNGVDVRKLVTNRNEFVTVIDPELAEPVLKILSSLNVYQLASQPKLLTQEEISELEEAAIVLREAYIEVFNSITPKVHHLTVHVIEFVREHGFYQLVGDQAIEHLHAICNSDMRKYCSYSNQKLVMLKLLTDEQAIRNLLFDTGVSVAYIKCKEINQVEKRKMVSNVSFI